MTRQALLAQLAILTREYRAAVMHEPGCLSAAEEYDLLICRRNLQDAARIGGEIPEYQNAAEHVEAA